ncbi:hypothetical protein ACB316_14285 [Aeromonas sanarellii]
MAGLWYRSGTIAVTGGSKKVVGTGTTWKSGVYKPDKGHLVWGPDGKPYELDYVESDTVLYLVTAYSGVTATGMAYSIDITRTSTIPAFSRELSAQLAYAQAQYDSWQQILTGSGMVTLTAPDGQQVQVPALSAFQPTSASLQALQDLVPAKDKLPVFNSATGADLVTLTAFMRTLLDDADGSEARRTLNALANGKNTLNNAGAGVGFESSDNSGLPWVAAYAGNVKDDAVVVMGSLGGSATVGAHNAALNEWKDLYLNANKDIFIGGRSVYLESPKSVVQHPTLGNVKNSIPSIGSYDGTPGWFVSNTVLRVLSIQDLATAASNGQTSQIDWAYLKRFEFFVRVYVDAPSVNVWRHSYAFQISGCGLQSTNDGALISYPFRFTGHTTANKGDVKHQFVTVSENNGCPYWEVHFPAGVNVALASDKVLGYSIRAVEMW